MAQRQRKGTGPQKAGGNNTVFYIVLGVIALAGVIAIAYALSGGGAGSAATEPIDLQASTAQEIYEQATPMTLGNDGAPAKIVEFADFQCPACGSFALGVKPQIMPYIERGDAQLVYYDFPLGGAHIHAFLAARAARCAGDQELEGADSFWAMHDKLYQEQANWSVEQNAADDFVAYAAEIGLDRGGFERCLNSDRFADVVSANRLLGEQLGVRGTPTVLINNRQVGGRNINEMGAQLIRLLEEIVGAGAGTAR